jgi:creatinine amidohydrolase
MLTSGYWQDLTSDQLQGVDPEQTIAILPVSAVEQHGPHLPLCTDAVINQGIVDCLLSAVPKTLTVLVLPALTIGHSLEHTDYAGTLTSNAETLLALWVDVGRCAARSGIRKLIFLNSHGGQTQLVDIAALRLRAELRILTVRADYFRLGSPDGLFGTKELAFGIHGGEVETSLMLHLRPDLVRLDALNDFDGLPARLAHENRLLGVEEPVGIGWMSQDLNPAGVVGNAAGADAARGSRLLSHLTERLVLLLRETAAMPLSRLQKSALQS